jgi:hypothetical protein
MDIAVVEVPKIEFVTAICWDGSFRENVDAVRCLMNQRYPRDRYEVIFVDYYDRIHPDVLELAGEHDNLTAVTLGHPHPGTEDEHRIACCVNEGLRRARGDLIFIPDADTVFADDLLEEIVREHERCEELVLHFRRMDEGPTDSPAPRNLEELTHTTRLEYPLNYGAGVAVRKRWLETINGYDEDPVFRGYSTVLGEASNRLATLGLAVKWHPSRFLYHGRHPGTTAPGPENVSRMRAQMKIRRRRGQLCETLPNAGLDPSIRPRHEVRAQPSRRSRLGGLVRRALPGRLCGSLAALLRDNR